MKAGMNERRGYPFSVEMKSNPAVINQSILSWICAISYIKINFIPFSQFPNTYIFKVTKNRNHSPCVLLFFRNWNISTLKGINIGEKGGEGHVLCIPAPIPTSLAMAVIIACLFWRVVELAKSAQSCAYSSNHSKRFW
jgi:hypothetical protein